MRTFCMSVASYDRRIKIEFKYSPKHIILHLMLVISVSHRISTNHQSNCEKAQNDLIGNFPNMFLSLSPSPLLFPHQNAFYKLLP